MTKVFFSILSSILILCIALSTACPAYAQTLEVGAGCKYSSIQSAINAASQGDKIKILSGTFSIDNSISPISGIELSGAGVGKTIIYTDSFSDCSSYSNPGLIHLNGVSNVYINNITLQGPATSQEDQHNNGGTTRIGGLREARNGIKISNSKDIIISNCEFKLLLSDGVRITSSENIHISNCKIYAGHDSISAFGSRVVTVNNCYVDLLINTCFRFYNSENCTISNSTFIQSMGGSGAGYLELEGSVRDAKITHNVFLSSSDPVLFVANPRGGNAIIENNILYGVGGLSRAYNPYSVSMSNNTVYNQAYNFTSWGYGYNSGRPAASVPAVSVPAASVPAASVPAASVPAASVPAVSVPAVSVPAVSMPTDTYQTLLKESREYKEKGESLLNGTPQERALGYQYLKLSQSKYALAQSYKQTQTGWTNGIL